MRELYSLAMAAFVVVSTGLAEEKAQELQPQDYSALHVAASQPNEASWAGAIRRLGQPGDAFTLEHFKKVEAQKLDSTQAKMLKAAAVAIRNRLGEEDVSTFTKLIELRLERAAWADLNCNPLERTLVPWTLDLIGNRFNSPEVKAELKRLAAEYVPQLKTKTWFGSMERRVRAYAMRVLAAAGGGSKRQP